MPAPPPGLPTQKTTLAAAIFLVMFVVSATVALWTGYLLLHGEEAEQVFAALPAHCDWVVLADHPDEVAQAWDAVAAARQLPESVTTTAHEQAALWRDLAATPGLDPKQAWALCGRAEGKVAALAATGGTATQPGQVWLERLQRHQSPGPQAGAWTEDQGRAVFTDPAGRVLAAVQRDGDLVRAAWASPGHDANTMLTAVIAEAKRNPLQKNEIVRGAFERVGGGQLHLYVAPEFARTALKDLKLSEELRAGLELATWFAVVLRHDEDGVRAHAQVGTGPRGAVWLKERLDPAGPALDAAPLLPADTQAAVVVRVNPKRLPLTDLPGVAWLDDMLKQQQGIGLEALGAVSTGQAIFLQRGETQQWSAVLQVRAGQGATNLGQEPKALEGDQILWSSDPAGLQSLRSTIAAKLPALGGLTRDQKRLLADTQGVFLKKGASLGPLRGPLQIEWLWLDTGLVAEVAVPR